MANFLNYIVESSIQPVKTNVLWIKNGVPYYFNKKWKPLLGSGSGGGGGEVVIDTPVIYGDGINSAILKSSNNTALGENSVALGINLSVNNISEAAFGKFNKSVISKDLSKATLFTVGNGVLNSPKNAFEIRYDNSIYVYGIEDSIQNYLKYLKATDESFSTEFEKTIQDINSAITETNSKIEQTAEQILLSVEKTTTELDGKITENTSAITITAEAIRSEVSQIEKDLSDAITENSTSITQTANQIQSVAKSVETIDGKVNEQQTVITQTSERIESLATKNEELENKTIENSSRITQTAQQIESEVSRLETKYDGEIETTNKTVSSIDQKADSINLRVDEVNTVTTGLQTQITENKSAINQTSQTIELLVEEDKTLSDRITKNESDIKVNSDNIALSVKQSEFDTLNSKVEENTSAININTDSIKSKVEQSSFDAFSGEVNNQFTEVNQSIEGITTTVQSNTGKITVIEETVDGLTSKTGTLEAEIESLKKQSDGSIDTHFGTTIPTLDNEPAVNWDTDELKNEHTGDIYYNNITGEAYRFSYDPQTNTYFWVELTDSALTDALEKISKLEEAIDGKVTIFYTQPSNYKYGDIWFVHNSSYSPYKEGSLLTATNLAKDAIVESFNLNHWVLKADIVKSLNDLDKTVTDAFKDNIITIAEVDAIKESKKAFEASFQELTSAHAIVIATTLGNSTKLKTAYSNLESKYNVFIQSIDSLVLDSNGNLSDVLLQAYTTAYNDYVEALKNYSKAKEELTDSIQRELSSANDYIKDISSDGVITPIEKKNLIEIWRSIAEEFNTNKGIAVNYKIIDSEGNERTDIYSDGIYYSNYALYEAAFDEIKTIFTSDVFGISNTTTSTTLPEGYSINDIDSALNNYYDTLSVFAEMISKITIEITDAHEKVLQLSKELQEQLSPSDNITQIGKGVILSSIIGVQSNGVLQAGLNATNVNGLVDTSKDNHGRIVFAGGINGATDWNTANTVIYEDGYVHFKWGEIDEGVEIGNALIRSVVSGTIDLFSYPENGTLVPLFIVNKDNSGKIVSISTPYDFIANKNLIVHGDTSSGGEGGSSSVGIQGIKLNGTTYRDENSDGIIDLGTIGGGTLTEITYEMIVEALGYTPLSTSGGTINGIFKIHNTAGAYNSVIEFSNTSGYLGALGVSSYNRPVFYNGAAYEDILTTSGGTIYGTDNQPLTIKGVAEDAYIGFKRGNDSVLGAIGINVNLGPVYWDNTNRVNRRFLHEGNYSDYALPKTGGTIENVTGTYTPLFIKTTDPESWIGFTDNVGTYYIGTYRGVPSVYKSGVGTHTLYHTGNFNPANYLPLSGGTINTTSAYGLAIDSSTNESGILLNSGGTSVGILIAGGNWGTAIINPKANYVALGVKDDGTAYVGSNTILTSAGGTIDGDLRINAEGTISLVANAKGNSTRIVFFNNGTPWGYLAFTALNTPKFITATGTQHDLIHAGNYSSYALPLSGGTIDSPASIPLIINSTSDYHTLMSFHWSSSEKARVGHTAGVGAHLTNMVSGGVLKITDAGALMFNDNTLIHSGNIGEYALKTDGSNVMTGSLNFRTDTVLYRFANDSSGSPSWYNGSVWKTIAFTDSNVASATKLATARTIWGQSFDGTGDVWGNLNLHSDKLIFNSDASNYFISCQGTSLATYNMYGGHSFCTLGGTQRMLINASGNVTIGASDLAGTGAKLYVNGAIVSETTAYNASIGSNAIFYYNKTNGGFFLYGGIREGEALSIERAGNTGSWVGSGIVLRQNGNVLIGTREDNGAKLQVEGNTTINGNLVVAGDISA